MKFAVMTGLILAATTMSGCATAEAPNEIPQHALAQCAEDSVPRFLTKNPRVESLLLLGQIADPAVSDGELIPGRPSVFVITTELTDYMEGLGLSEMDVFMTVLPATSASHLFGPRQPLTPGVYRLSRKPASDRECSEYRAVTAATSQIHAMEPTASYRSSILSDPNECLTYRFVATTPDLSRYSHVVYEFDDVVADREGYGRNVEEMRDRSSVVVARAATYDFRQEPWTCATAPAKLLASLFLNGGT